MICCRGGGDMVDVPSVGAFFVLSSEDADWITGVNLLVDSSRTV